MNQAQDLSEIDAGYDVQSALSRGDQVVVFQETSVEGLLLAQLAWLLASLVLTSTTGNFNDEDDELCSGVQSIP